METSMVNGGIVWAVQHQDQVLDNLLSDLLLLHHEFIFTKPIIFASSVKPPLEENPLSLLWPAINVKEFLEGINLPMKEGFLKEVQEPSPPVRVKACLLWFTH